MKVIRDLDVTVTYRVGLGDLEVPDEVRNQLIEAAENQNEITMHSEQYPDAYAWLSNNIQERDCFDWNCEITDIIE